MDDDLIEVYRQHKSAQDKLTYFLLAVTASAIAFAVQKSEGINISTSMIPLGLSGISWALSFFYGIRKLMWTIAVLYANMGLLQLKNGIHPNQPNHPDEVKAAIQGIRNAANQNIDGAERSSKRQSGLFIFGTVCFIVWIVLKMIISTYGSIQVHGIIIK